MAHNILVCALLAMAPVVELRGALPAGLAMGIPALPLYLLCVVCNLIPVPFIIVFIRRILGWMARRGGKLGKIAAFVERHAHKKLEIYRKYEMLGLFILVAIPLPGTGAWTGALIAGLRDLRLRYALPVIGAGVAAAGIIMLALSHGLFAGHDFNCRLRPSSCASASSSTSKNPKNRTGLTLSCFFSPPQRP